MATTWQTCGADRAADVAALKLIRTGSIWIVRSKSDGQDSIWALPSQANARDGGARRLTAAHTPECRRRHDAPTELARALAKPDEGLAGK